MVGLNKKVFFYRSKEQVTDHDEEDLGSFECGMVIMIPEVKLVDEIPYFHPAVKRLVFYYESTRPPDPDTLSNPTNPTFVEPTDTGTNPSDEEPKPRGTITLSYLPFASTLPLSTTQPPLNGTPIPLFPPSQSPTTSLTPPRSRPPRKRSPLASTPLGAGSDQPDHIPPPALILQDHPEQPIEERIDGADEAKRVAEDRLYRTCLGLLERVWKFGFGRMVGYRKRVEHDVSEFLCIMYLLRACGLIGCGLIPVLLSGGPNPYPALSLSLMP